MSRTPQPLFIDTGGFYAHVDDDDTHHEQATAVFEAIAAGEYGPVFTSRYVLAELATLVLYNVSHRKAVTAFNEIRDSATINLLPVDPDTFDEAREQFEQYDDHEISFIDHLGGVLAANHDIIHVFAFDGDFATLGFTRVPVDTEIP